MKLKAIRHLNKAFPDLNKNYVKFTEIKEKKRGKK